MSATSPVRYPDASSPAVMTKRAWWLVALNFLIPGSAQLLAGQRGLGKLGVAATFAMWSAAVIGLLLLWLWPVALYTIVASPVALFVVQWLLVAYILLWLVLTLDTLRLVRLVKTSPRSRIAIAVVAIAGLVASGGVAGYGSTVAGATRGAITVVFDGGNIEPSADGRYNILLLGGDA
ncbi:MAG: LytR family transcriptional regulator, partial [Microbacteriaceae bacterium]|nr:LytR family transcriptional regulator [Microbacteriaceae bacterium]